VNTIQNFEERHKKIVHVLFFLILALGLSLRFYQYLMGRSLWEDEAHLALSFVTRDYAGILKPLDYIQAAPPLFLLTVKTFTLIFGNGESALRALPFITSILTLPLFYYLLLSITRSSIAALVGFLAFAVNIAVIYYSSELKTYGVDVAVYILMIYLAVSQYRFVSKRRNLLLGIAGCASLLYSNIAFIILFCVACYMMIGWLKNKKIERAQLYVLASWGILFIAYYLLFVHNHPYEAIQKSNYSFGFPPLPLFSSEFNAFMEKSIHEIGFRLLLYVSKSWSFAYILLFLIVVSIIHAFYKKKYALLLFTCLPILIHFTISLFHIYPFWYRLILYFVPVLIILMASGVSLVANFLARKTHVAISLIFTVYCVYFFSIESFKQYPLYYREVKPTLDHINKNYPHSFIYITTPYTLYKYYHLTGYVKDSLYEGLDWNNGHMSPETYYEAVEGSTSNYLLLHARDPGLDNFYNVLEDLKKRDLIVKEFTYKTYTVSEVKPLRIDSAGIITLNYTNFPPGKTFDLNGKKIVPIWNSDVSSNPIFLAKGKYKLTIRSGGTGVSGILPHLNVFINDNKIGDYTTSADYSPTDFLFEHPGNGNIIIKIVMDNDAIDNSKNEDRNAFIHTINISKAGN